MNVVEGVSSLKDWKLLKKLGMLKLDADADDETTKFLVEDLRLYRHWIASLDSEASPSLRLSRDTLHDGSEQAHAWHDGVC
jgi:hypothetical protein